MAHRFLTGCSIASLMLSPVAFAEEWVSIFNGKDLSGWIPKITGLALGEDPKNTFQVREGKLVVNYENYATFDNSFGHLFYDTPASHYRLRFEYRFIGKQLSDAPDWAYKNSGVMLHSQAPNSMLVDQAFPISLEGQLLGADENGQHRSTGNLCTPSTTVERNGKIIDEHCTNSSSDSFVGEQWVSAEFIVNGSHSIEQYINGERVFDYQNLKLDESRSASPTTDCERVSDRAVNWLHCIAIRKPPH